MKTTLRILLAGAAIAFPLAAQPVADMTLTAMLRQPYDLIKSNLIRAAEVMPEENYSFRPVPAEMSYGQWVAHIADSMTRYCGIVAGEMKNSGRRFENQQGGSGGGAEGVVREMRRDVRCADGCECAGVGEPRGRAGESVARRNAGLCQHAQQ